MSWFKKLKTFYAEKELSPEEVYIHGFKEGFNKAWEMMMPVMMEGVLKSKKSIEDQAIQETIRRNNGNYQKTH